MVPQHSLDNTVPRDIMGSGTARLDDFSTMMLINNSADNSAASAAVLQIGIVQSHASAQSPATTTVQQIFRSQTELVQNSSTPYSDATQTKKHPPGHVKRPMNPFMVWAQLQREQIRARQPDLHNAKISKDLGEKWRQMTEEEKDVYVKEAERLRILHQKEYPDYRYRPKKKTPKCSKTTTSSPSGSPASPTSPKLGKRSATLSTSSDDSRKQSTTPLPSLSKVRKTRKSPLNKNDANNNFSSNCTNLGVKTIHLSETSLESEQMNVISALDEIFACRYPTNDQTPNSPESAKIFDDMNSTPDSMEDIVEDLEYFMCGPDMCGPNNTTNLIDIKTEEFSSDDRQPVIGGGYWGTVNNMYNMNGLLTTANDANLNSACQPYQTISPAGQYNNNYVTTTISIKTEKLQNTNIYSSMTNLSAESAAAFASDSFSNFVICDEQESSNSGSHLDFTANPSEYMINTDYS